MAAVQPCFFLQTGSHPAQAFRRPLEAALRYSGIVKPTDLAVTAPAGVRAVDVAAGECIIIGTENALRQGAYACLNDATVQLAIAAADATNPRYDRIIAQVRDAEFSGALNDWTLAVVAGVPAAAPAEPALPANALELARLTVAAGAVSFTAANLLDRRPQVRSGSLLAHNELTANGVSAVGDHDAGLSLSFVMPALAAGQRVLLECNLAYFLFAAAAAAGSTLYAILRDGAGAGLATSFTWHTFAGSTSPAIGWLRRTLTNANYAAGTLVTVKLATTSSAAQAHAVVASADTRVELTASLI